MSRRRNNPKSNNNPRGGSLFLTLFALPFAGVGIGMLLLGVLPTLYDWSRMQFWQPVQAQLMSAKLNQHPGSKSGYTYSVSAHYRYQVGANTYEGRRPAINTSADNVGSFHEDLGRRLERALRSGTLVPAWFNPSAPEESVVDRSLRGGLLAFRMVFVVVFGGVGVGLLAWNHHMRRSTARKATQLQAVGGAPWLAHPAWVDNRIRSHKRWEVWFAWGFAVLWGCIAYPAALSAMPRAWRSENFLVLGVLLLLVAVGLGLLVWALRATWDARRHGDVRLIMDPFPGSIGGHVGATLDLPAVAYRPDLRFMVSLRCAYSDQNRSAGNSSSTESREHVAWQAEGAAQVQPMGQGSRVAFRLNVPNGLPASEEPVRDSEHRWSVLLESTDPALKFSRRFDVPVYATHAKSTWLEQDAASHPQTQAMHEAELDSVTEIQLVDGGVRLYQPYGRLGQQNLVWLVMGAFFFGVGVAVGRMGAPVFPLVFGGFGGAMLLWSFYALGNSLTVLLNRQGLHTERRLLGLMLAWQRVPANDIARLSIEESYSSQSGNKHTTFYRVQANLRNGGRVTIADSLRGRTVAEQLLVRITKATGYPR